MSLVDEIMKRQATPGKVLLTFKTEGSMLTTSFYRPAATYTYCKFIIWGPLYQKLRSTPPPCGRQPSLDEKKGNEAFGNERESDGKEQRLATQGRPNINDDCALGTWNHWQNLIYLSRLSKERHVTTRVPLDVGCFCWLVFSLTIVKAVNRDQMLLV